MGSPRPKMRRFSSPQAIRREGIRPCHRGGSMRRMALLVAAATLAAPVLWITQVEAQISSTATPVTVPLTRIGTASISGGTSSTDPALDLTEIDQATVGDTD